MMKKMMRVVLVGMLVASLVGCAGNEKKSNNTQVDAGNENMSNNTQVDSEKENTDLPETDGVNEQLEGTVVITGSTSVEKIVNDMIDEFQALNPRVTVNYTGTGSSAGIADTLAGSNDLGAASREVKQEEKTDSLKEVVFAHDGIAVIVNPANQVADISVDNLAKIYSGEITNWSQIGGADAEIVAVSREGASGTKAAFEELIKLEDAGGLTEKAAVVEGNGNVQTTVAGNENAIGYVSFSFIDETVKPLTIDSVEANAENAKAGTYPLSRPFLFVYNDKNYSDVTKAFVTYALSADGQAYVQAHGGIKIQ